MAVPYAGNNRDRSDRHDDGGRTSGKQFKIIRQQHDYFLSECIDFSSIR
jgi:hypothetical protein